MKAARGVVAILVGATLTLAGCTEDQAKTPPATTAPPSPVEPRPGTDFPTTGRGPQPPEKGAWLGAWVKPEWQTPTGRAAALEEFGQQTGAKLAIAHMFHEWQDEFPGPTQHAFHATGRLQMISWSGTDTRSIASGVYDQLIRQRAQEVKAFGVPVLLRWRWEMDRPNLSASVHSPGDYIAAWKHIRGIFTEVGTTNAAFVWCPHVQGFIEADRDAAAYYPGDDQVDWLCTDIYPGREFDSFAGQMDAFMAFARERHRPVMIGEFGVTSTGAPNERGGWLREAHQYVKTHPQIKAIVYFAAKQTKKPVYDTTFAEDPEGLAAFQELARDPYFASVPQPSMHPATPTASQPAG
ncbi:MAG TPA: beta-mannanase [Pilimelia sp.]|nr:beta-mannanase [Pilimelia sp.]